MLNSPGLKSSCQGLLASIPDLCHFDLGQEALVVTSHMSKRHQFGMDFLSRVRRVQELIMSRSGIDEFYEIIRLILAKYFSEQSGSVGLPSIDECNRLLAMHTVEVSFILDGLTNLQTPPGIFPEIQRILNDINIHRQDFSVLDQAFEQLTSRMYKADKGQYFTPRHVIDMCVEAIDPKPEEAVCDPACGSAAFLKSAHSYSKSKYGASPHLYGFDYSHRACQVAKVVSLIGTDGGIVVRQIDSLRLPQRTPLKDTSDKDTSDTIEDFTGADFRGFDSIITNPPFAGDVSGEAFARGYDTAAFFSRRLERDVLFVERCIRLLRVGGRLAIILPDNKVSSRLFADFRHWLGKQSMIKAVVSLHRYTFLPYTSQKAVVIFAIKQAPSLSIYEGDIAFFRSDKPGKSSNGSLVFKPGADPNVPAYHSLDHDLQEVAAEIRKTLCAA